MPTRRVTASRAVLGAVVLAFAGTTGPALATHLDEPPDPQEAIDDPIPGHIADGDLQMELQTLAEGGGLTAPNWGTWAPGVPGVLFVVDQDGPLWAVDTATGDKRLVLDTGELLVPLILEADERGFLGAAFHPGFATNGLLYTMTSEPGPLADGQPASQPNHYATVREWRLDPESQRPLHGPSGSRVVLQVLEPQFNHNGGAIFFGTRADDRDLLYITSGDGGCADDQHLQLGLVGEGPCISHEGPGNAQRLDTLLGKILRINPMSTAGGAHYTPAGAGIPGALPEIYAYGFRNPYRASSDRQDLGGDGGIWTGDVGQNQIEEVDGPVEPGGNYGWREKEGTYLFNPNGVELNGFASDGFIWANAPGTPGLIDPVAQYDHDEGVAVVGGFVYRGRRLPELRGTYVFGDYSDGFHSGNGRVMYVDESYRPDPHDSTPRVLNLVNGHTNVFVLGFGEDEEGELYVLANGTGGPEDETGVVLKIVRECADDADCRD